MIVYFFVDNDFIIPVVSITLLTLHWNIEKSPTMSSFPINETSCAIETSTNTNNFTDGNSSLDESNLQLNEAQSLVRWMDLGPFRFSYWGILLFIVVFGIIGNILVLVMMRDARLRYLSYSIYLRFLAVSDSVLLLTYLISETEKIFGLNRFTPAYFCITAFSVRTLAALLSPWLVVCLTVDRFVCVSFPLKRGTLCTWNKAIIVCSVAFCLSLVFIAPFPFGTNVRDSKCFPSEEVRSYYIFVHLILSALIPCLVIFLLTVLIVIQIRRSRNFRKSFLRPRSDSANGQQDSSTRPLVLVSLLAFVTLMPVALSKSVRVLRKLRNQDLLVTNLNIWQILFMIYLLNFGLNFYVLIASSSNYRNAIKRRLCCGRWKASRQNHSLAIQSVITSSSDVTGLPLGSDICVDPRHGVAASPAGCSN